MLDEVDGMMIIFQQKICVQTEHGIGGLGIMVIVYHDQLQHNVVMYWVIQKLVFDQVEIGMHKMVCEGFMLTIVRL